MPSTLPKEIVKEKNDNKQGGNTKKYNAEILTNVKPKEIGKVISPETHQKLPNRVRGISNRRHKHYKNRRLRKKIKQITT